MKSRRPQRVEVSEQLRAERRPSAGFLCCSWSLNVEPANLQMLSPGPGKIIHIVLVTNMKLDSDKSVATETRKYHSMLEPGAEWMCLRSSTRVCQSQGFRKEKPSPSSSLPTR